MRICFCLPGPSEKPAGGFKIIFEYANQLCERGHEVTLFFNYSKNNVKNPLLLKWYHYKIMKHPKWFSLNKQIRKIYLNGIKDINIPDSDIIVATAVTTAQSVNKLSQSKGEKVYFIQDFENWVSNDEVVFESYRLPMKKVVISESSSILIRNGINLNVFCLKKLPEQRYIYSVCMMYHTQKRKGVEYGMEALYKLKNKYPQMKATCFGTPARPKNMPNWINYWRNANPVQLSRIYNDSAIFLSTSISEGFGLTGLESMACGCALVSTSNNGVNEYAVHRKNSQITIPQSAESLFEAVDSLFSDNRLRVEIALNGHATTSSFKWDNAVSLLEKTFLALSSK
ncbi:MAG: glycosyltransferase family 4 protein [Candidatus Cloacimonetes bacterium]|nr:glycosyltransferase family 4 protein [Candidatus Cloacimonadota bacterium]